jgi:hypothetical protein
MPLTTAMSLQAAPRLHGNGVALTEGQHGVGDRIHLY